MKTILFFHQSADLYGSDKVLLSLVKGLNKDNYNPVVLLPCQGPLLNLLHESGITTYVIPLVTISRSTLSIKGLLRLPINMLRSMISIRRALKDIKIDLVHSNTLAVLSGALWAKSKGIKHVWHIHEMIVGPWYVRKFLSWLLLKFADKVVCNSYATRKLIVDSQPRLSKKSIVIWNGIENGKIVDSKTIDSFRKQLGVGTNDVLVALVGRINRWKGQGLLVDAANLLWENGIRNIKYLIVGSAPRGQEHFRDNLISHIAVLSAKEQIKLMDYRDDIWTIWASCDIAVVPSIEPEPFGLVAIEAMAAKKPVIAAAHGGLIDIVVNGVTGILFEPNNLGEFADAIEKLAIDREKRTQMGENGYRRAKEFFTVQNFVCSFELLYNKLMRAYSS